jgi:hypothetical protein
LKPANTKRCHLGALLGKLLAHTARQQVQHVSIVQLGSNARGQKIDHLAASLGSMQTRTRRLHARFVRQGTRAAIRKLRQSNARLALSRLLAAYGVTVVRLDMHAHRLQT